MSDNRMPPTYAAIRSAPPRIASGPAAGVSSTSSSFTGSATVARLVSPEAASGAGLALALTGDERRRRIPLRVRAVLPRARGPLRAVAAGAGAGAGADGPQPQPRRG